MGSLGRHTLVDVRATPDPRRLGSPDWLESVVREAVVAGKATLLQVVSHVFPPAPGWGYGGVTVVAILSESHVSIHTYPETGVWMADVFTCGDVADPDRAIDVLVDRIGGEVVYRQTVQRMRPDTG